ncbi:MAG: L-threonylcarbamoyladenylate synthase [Thermoanaerobacteraceae bacterium]|nr:L-threonylcarbamoyladenylate synthase [Thermoanaerobacteraceae bacterium]
MTEIYWIDENNIDDNLLFKAAKVLRDGGIAAFPTETVYGLGANALDSKAVKKIFRAKGRPSDNPLIVHVADYEGIFPLVAEINEAAEALIHRFMPGPITIVMKKSTAIPDEVTAGLDTVGIRMPSHRIASRLIKLAGVPVAAPSANLSGKPSPTRPEHVIHDMDGRVDVIIADGICDVGVESTVIDVTGDIPMILRPGGVTFEELQSVLGKVEIDPAILKKPEKDMIARAPGMKYTHYSPDAEVVIVSGPSDMVVREINRLSKEDMANGKKVAVLASDETKGLYDIMVIPIGSKEDKLSISGNLFAALRKLDDMGIDKAYAEAVDEEGLGLAIMNRMKKAAGYRIIKVGEK